MRILITGGAGFIALHLVKHIIRVTRWHIVLVDNLSAYPCSWKRLEEEGLSAHPRITRITWDLTKPFTVGILNEIGKVNILIHLAVSHKIEDTGNNTLALINILEFCHDYLDIQLIYLSHSLTIAPSLEPQEEWSTQIPNTSLGWMLLAHENTFWSFVHKYDLNGIIINVGPVYGEYAPLDNFLVQNLRGVTALPQGFLHGQQLAEALLFIAKNSTAKEKYHISSTDTTAYQIDAKKYTVRESSYLACDRLHKMGFAPISGWLYWNNTKQWYEINENWIK
jgi:nucleoside-diphosphate-sugar epimerase